MGGRRVKGLPLPRFPPSRRSPHVAPSLCHAVEPSGSDSILASRLDSVPIFATTTRWWPAPGRCICTWPCVSRVVLLCVSGHAQSFQGARSPSGRGVAGVVLWVVVAGATFRAHTRVRRARLTRGALNPMWSPNVGAHLRLGCRGRELGTFCTLDAVWSCGASGRDWFALFHLWNISEVVVDPN